MAKFDGPSIAMVGVGAILVYAGIYNYSVLAVVGNAITGKPLTTNADGSNHLVIPNSNVPAATDGASTNTSPPPGLSSNQTIGHELAGGYGWQDTANWTALVQLWNRESSWNNHAQNPSSGAYGIPQALPYTKMPQTAWPESKGGKSDPSAQISWGLEYIKERYGNPQAAWAHETSQGWY